MQKWLWITPFLLSQKNAHFQTQQLLLKCQGNPSILVMKKAQQLLFTAFTEQGRHHLYIHVKNMKHLWIQLAKWDRSTQRLMTGFFLIPQQLFQHANGLNKTKIPSRRLISKSNIEPRCDIKKQHSPGLLRISVSQRKRKTEQKKISLTLNTRVGS